MVINAGVVEEIYSLPSTPRPDTKRRHDRVQIVRAVGVPKVALVFIVPGRAGEAESVMTATGILNHLNHRLHIPVKILRVKAGAGIATAHQGAGGGHINMPLFSLIKTSR